MFKKLAILVGIVAILGLVACGKSIEQLVKAGQAVVGVAGEAYKDAKENLEAVKEALKEEPKDEASE